MQRFSLVVEEFDYKYSAENGEIFRKRWMRQKKRIAKNAMQAYPVAIKQKGCGRIILRSHSMHDAAGLCKIDVRGLGSTLDFCNLVILAGHAACH